MGDEKKLVRVIKEQQEGEMRRVSSQFKTDYKKAKQQLKQVSNLSFLSRINHEVGGFFHF